MAQQPGSRKPQTSGPATPTRTAATGADTDSAMDAPSLAPERDTGTMHDTSGTMRETVASGASTGERPRSTNGGQGWTGVLKEATTSRLSKQKHRASAGIDGVAQALRETTDKLSGEGRTAVADYARQAASQLERFSRRLDEQDLDQMLQTAQRFARSQPWAFVGAAFGLGLIAARFFKSSSAAYESRSAYGPRWRQESSGRGTYARAEYADPAYGTGPTS